MPLRSSITVALAAAFLSAFLAGAQPARKSAPDSPAARPALDGTGSAALSPLLFTDMELLNDSVKLGKGDHVTFRVIEDEEDPKSLTVNDAGELEVPYLGLVRATEKT